MREQRCGSPAPAIGDYGPNPLVVNIRCLAEQTPYFRTALWTGRYMQITLMCIPPRGEIGLEMHPDVDQLIRVEAGCGLVMMGDGPETLGYRQAVDAGYGIVIPAGTWHNLVNTGCDPLKLVSVYAPPQHPFGTVHKTKADADAWET